MAAQHLPRDLLRPSSRSEELAQTMKYQIFRCAFSAMNSIKTKNRTMYNGNFARLPSVGHIYNSR